MNYYHSHDTRRTLELIFPLNPVYCGQVVVPFNADEERANVEKFFRGKNWGGIDFAMLRKHHPGPVSELPGLMTDNGAAYFFPFFIACLVEHPGKCDALAEALLSRVVRDFERAGHMKECFNQEQRRYVSDFLLSQFSGSRGYRDEIALAVRHLSPECTQGTE